MQIVLNGERRDVDDGLSVAALIDQLELNNRRIAVELNRQILPREEFAARVLADGDQLEIVHFVGGG